MVRTFLAGLALVLAISVPSDADGARRSPRIKGSGETLALKAFKKNHGMTDAETAGLLSAVGRLRCPWGIGTAFLLAGSDLVVTSRHMFRQLDPRSRRLNQSRGNAYACVYHPLVGEGRYKLAKGSLIEGPGEEGLGLADYWNDWAIARLTRPVEGARPLMPGRPDVKPGDPALVVSQGMNDTITRICTGAVDTVDEVLRQPGFTSNCDTGQGASGGPVIAADLEEARLGQRPVVGLTLGWITLPGKEARHFVVPLSRELMGAVGRSLSGTEKLAELAAFYRDGRHASAGMALIAEELYTIAAMRGEAEAFYWLGQIQLDAFADLPGGKSEAYGWLEIAAEKLPPWHPALAKALEGLAELSASLSAAQLDEGRKRVEATLARRGYASGLNP